ncbi:hypothetical protein FX988_02212 [Paraglaciecola mesophila]|uniref:Solute-binding protein family 3/N-terminal domain-containing protein n=1 Tax=Paraglaciecola mesophila TaxID=197222 RepID=A0A857JLU8_9ALTE|nr:amino acid ABC transporter substrate-binding protein [Paraglaciecola mesophila]QHJ11971.1 hypothetical protein FX988_02212 [Paraglaciecola mesophila]
MRGVVTLHHSNVVGIAHKRTASSTKGKHAKIATYLFLLLCLIWSLAATSAIAEQTILYPMPESVHDQRPLYPVRLLALAISKLEKPYRLKQSRSAMTQSRALRMMERENAPDIVWSMTTQEREKAYIPIRIPIYKGLIGWRLFLIHAGQQGIFDEIDSLSDLQTLTAGQGHDWPDTYILNNSHIDVMSSSKYERLFEMLNKERFNFFPRSIIEIWDEISARPHYNLAIEKHILLRYPAAIYFFVAKNNAKLATDIQRGLQLAIEDGSFEQMFLKHNEWLINKACLSERHIIDLPNPLLPPLTPVHNEALWYHVDE